jgi:hypothetical protein
MFQGFPCIEEPLGPSLNPLFDEWRDVEFFDLMRVIVGGQKQHLAGQGKVFYLPKQRFEGNFVVASFATAEQSCLDLSSHDRQWGA